METRQSYLTWIVVIVAMPLFYFLSIGPILWLDNQFPAIVPHKVLEIVYAPVQWLYDNNEWFEKFYEWYIPIWE